MTRWLCLFLFLSLLPFVNISTVCYASLSVCWCYKSSTLQEGRKEKKVKMKEGWGSKVTCQSIQAQTFLLRKSIRVTDRRITVPWIFYFFLDKVFLLFLPTDLTGMFFLHAPSFTCPLYGLALSWHALFLLDGNCVIYPLLFIHCVMATYPICLKCCQLNHFTCYNNNNNKLGHEWKWLYIASTTRIHFYFNDSFYISSSVQAKGLDHGRRNLNETFRGKK